MWLVPILAGLAVGRFVRNRAVARAIGIAVAALVVPLAFVVFVSSQGEVLTASSVRALAVGDLEVDGLSSVLLPLVTCLSLGVLVAIPRSDVDVDAVLSLLVAEGATLGVLVSANVVLLGGFWALSLLPMAMEARRSRDIALSRATRWAGILCVVPMLAALVAIVALALLGRLPKPLDVRTIAASGVAIPYGTAIAPALLVAGAARMGIFPFHVWIPVALGRGRLAVMLPSIVSPLGSFAVVRLALGLFPDATRRASHVMMIFAVISALYGAVVALGQNHARRQIGYLWTSFAGFVLAGIATMDAQGLSGALVHDLALTIAITGLALIVRSVEARTGTADFRRLGGLVLQLPRMATGYFLLGAAAVGFPATVTFVSEDLVVQGLVRTRPVFAVLFLVAMAVNGVTLVRSFKRIFLGPASAYLGDHSKLDDLLVRERWVSVLFFLALLAGGSVPTPLLAIRRQVETGILANRRPLGQLKRPSAGADTPSVVKQLRP
jgi:NADH-quinone oxidoreductase subunit M